INGNSSAAPDFALSSRDGHQSARSGLRDAAAFSPVPVPAAREDLDGDPRSLGARADLGADELRVPAQIGERVARRGSVHTLGLVAETSGAALLLLAPSANVALPLFGATLRLDPLAATTLVLPLALDARGVGRVDLPVPSRGSFPLDELWAQALVLRTGASPELTPARRIVLR
ncbi:MAG: hypothetical protein JNM84_08135, partial [Planctomycetes bacterium]|nr:hypothetical protein [Planctomycetota bacterium]